jgi:hypothetical protein
MSCFPASRRRAPAVAQRARGRATCTRTNREVHARAVSHASIFTPASAQPPHPDAGVGARILRIITHPRDHHADRLRTPLAHPGRATPAGRPRRGPANRWAPLRCTTRTTLRPPMRLQHISRLGARVGTPCAPAPCALYTAQPCALCRRQEQQMLIMPRPACRHTCRGLRAADAAEAQDPR